MAEPTHLPEAGHLAPRNSSIDSQIALLDSLVQSPVRRKLFEKDPVKYCKSADVFLEPDRSRHGPNLSRKRWSVRRFKAAAGALVALCRTASLTSNPTSAATVHTPMPLSLRLRLRPSWFWRSSRLSCCLGRGGWIKLPKFRRSPDGWRENIWGS